MNKIDGLHKEPGMLNAKREDLLTAVKEEIIRLYGGPVTGISAHVNPHGNGKGFVFSLEISVGQSKTKTIYVGLERTWKARLPEAYKKACQLREEYYKQKVNRILNRDNARYTQTTLGGFNSAEELKVLELKTLHESYSSRYNALLEQVKELNARYAIGSAALLKKLKK